MARKKKRSSGLYYAYNKSCTARARVHGPPPPGQPIRAKNREECLRIIGKLPPLSGYSRTNRKARRVRRGAKRR